MKTDDLIRALSQDTVAEAPVWKAALLRTAPAIALSLVALLLTLGPRADLAQAMTNPLSLLRFVLTLLLAALSLRALMDLSRPEAGLRRSLAILAVPVLAGGLWVWAWFATPDEGRQMAMVGKTMVTCLTTIPLLSLLPVAALFTVLRGAAPTAPALAGAVAGLAGGGLAAAAYAVHCTEDSPLFYVTWYGLAIVIVTLVSALIGSRLLRW